MARADRHIAKRKRKDGRFRVFIIVLAVAALAIAGGLLWVMTRPALDKDGMVYEGPETESPEKAENGDLSASDAKQPEEGEKAPENGEEQPSEATPAAMSLKEIAAQMQDYSLTSSGKAEPVSVVDDNILLLINKTHPLSSDYYPQDMVKIERNDPQVGTAEVKQMRAVAAEHFEELLDAAHAAGYNIVLRNAFRSYSYQDSLFSSYAKNHGEDAANRYSARPGESEHQTGLCCDVGVPGRSLTSFNGSAEAAWMAEHAHEFGFILRFPEGKEDITGYMFESWHFRYVGLEAAGEIYERGITLEEYLDVTY